MNCLRFGFETAKPGYGRYYAALKTFLESQPFASDITITGAKDPGVTGNFEVTIVESDQLIHSKQQGMGLPKNDSVMNAIAVHIEDALS